MTSKNSNFLLDNISPQDIRLQKARHDAIAAYVWDHYSYFANQRSFIINELKIALAQNCHPFEFKHWQRVINYQHSLEPLSARGSLINTSGGRFNIGNVDQMKFPRFAALYIAQDRETAYKEKFGLHKGENHSGLTSDDLILTSEDSITIVSVKGYITQVLDLNDPAVLKDFFALIRKIKLPNAFIKRAKKLNISPMLGVKSVATLQKTILMSDWRMWPMQFDIPANSQILGQIAFLAGIEAILYPSKMSGKNKKNCLAIFPDNFSKSDSFVEIETETPKETKCKRLDAQTYKNVI